MIPPEKLFQIQRGQRRRKLALCFGALERDIVGAAEKGCGYSFASLSREDYTKKLLEILLTDPALSPEAQADIQEKLQQQPFNELLSCNSARNHLLSIIGTFPAEWDLIISPHTTTTQRPFFPGLMVYAEDIRSPFNLGSIFRTAEAFGCEKLFLSPFCCDPLHPRAQRSAMGCIDTLPWERKKLQDLPDDVPVFVLETGGTNMNDFLFPQKGIVIIGSEELGVSPEALSRARYGHVTIPLYGIKASLNVGIAFGILMENWVNSLGTYRP